MEAQRQVTSAIAFIAMLVSQSQRFFSSLGLTICPVFIFEFDDLQHVVAGFTNSIANRWSNRPFNEVAHHCAHR